MHGDNALDPRDSRRYEEGEIDLGEYLAILRKVWWKAALCALAIGIITAVVMLQSPNIYQATALITPVLDEKKQNPALGALASFGLELGGPSKVEDLETLFRSNDLAVRVFKKYDLWPVVLGSRFDPASGTFNPSWFSRLFESEKKERMPGDWDAIRAARTRLKVSVNRKVGTVSVSFESPSAEASANVVRYFIDEGKSRLQEEALDRATKNKKFIEDQIGKTVDALTRDRLYALYGQEVEREMLARNREQFGFRIVDSPRAPDTKSRPARGRAAILATLLALVVTGLLFLRRERQSRQS